MSLTFSSPRRPTRAKNDGDNDDDKDEFHSPYGNKISPLNNNTLLGQFNQYTGSHRENDKDDVIRHSPHTRSHSSVFSEHKTLSLVQYQHLYVLPVLLLEFLAIALTRAVLPSILIQQYGSNVYLILGCADCIRGILAFFSCPLFGKLSDVLGRKICLFVTVLGSCSPVCSLAFFTWDDTLSTLYDESDTSSYDKLPYSVPPLAIPVFILLLSLSGLFSSTFTLVFAYISDSVQERNERVTAYGLALATFGLSFTVGPMAGGYLANSKTDYVFQCTLVLTLLDLLYIYAILPESISPRVGLFKRTEVSKGCVSDTVGSDSSSTSITTTAMLVQVAKSISWSPWDSIRLVLHDPFLRKVGQVAFFYYTGLWAVVSTLSLYAVQHFHMKPQILGELMSALGLSTMIAEAILVRVLVPWVGEKRAIRIGLISFGLQCLVLGAANEPWQLFFCVGLSLLGNLVYPSLSSLVSGIVESKKVGESLGAINGIKALTEGIGPLFFGTLMTLSEHTAFPGSPYWLAGILVFVAYHLADKLPASSEPSSDKHSQYHVSPPEEEYIHELEFKRRYPYRRDHHDQDGVRRKNSMVIYADGNDCLTYLFPTPIRDEEDEEYQALLSEVDEESEELDEIDPTSTLDTNRIIFDNGEDKMNFATKPSQR
mmetsp:Transcript_48661/g.54418  ORF Transcript_48661/g.54418 Transcript_48661/m.54418 type:complete len:655 (+) Transcript_48661:164-2128(+)